MSAPSVHMDSLGYRGMLERARGASTRHTNRKVRVRAPAVHGRQPEFNDATGCQRAGVLRRRDVGIASPEGGTNNSAITNHGHWVQVVNIACTGRGVGPQPSTQNRRRSRPLSTELFAARIGAHRLRYRGSRQPLRHTIGEPSEEPVVVSQQRVQGSVDAQQWHHVGSMEDATAHEPALPAYDEPNALSSTCVV